MASSKYFKFFASEKGRRFTFYGTTTAALSAFCIKYIPHSFLTDKHKEIVASYENGIERKISETLERRFVMALNSLKITDAERNFFTPFMVSGFDLYSFGSSKLLYGGFVGIPINYSYTAADEIPKGEVTVRGSEQVHWNTEAGHLLQQSLVLSEPEQIFGMCKEILELQTNKVLFNSLYATAAIFFYYAFTHNINAKQELFRRPLSLRIVLYSLTGLFTLGVYFFLKDFTQVFIDESIDEKLADLGINFLAGGISYYDKILKKNMAIKKLTNSNDYTALGNLNSYFRVAHKPLTERRFYFQDRLKKYLQEQEKMKNENETSN